MQTKIRFEEHDEGVGGIDIEWGSIHEMMTPI